MKSATHPSSPVDTSNAIDGLLAAAARHGDSSGNDHEIGDLQDLLRAAWALLTPEQRSEMIRSPEASNVLESGFGVRLFSRESDVLEEDWERAGHAFGLGDSFQYGADQVLDAVNMERFAAIASQDEAPTERYVYGFWGHIFGPGRHETMTRMVFDRVDNCLAYLQLKSGAGSGEWVDASRDQIADVEDSLKNANQDVIDDPGQLDLTAGNDLPSWAQPAQDGRPHVDRPRMCA